MKQILSIFSSILVLTASAVSSHAARETYDQLKIAAMQGEVKVCRDGECEAAQAGRALQIGETVQVGAGGRATLRIGKDTYELRERSRMLVDRMSRRENRLSMLLGVLKARVHASWFGRRQVAVVTPTGVMAVRGTEFMLNVNEGGDTRLDVLFGRVDFLNAITGKREGSFVQGESGNARAAGEGEASTGMDKGRMEPEAFEEAFGGAQGFRDFQKSDGENKNAVRRFEAGEAAKVAEAVSVVRENDLASGRTLRDRFGNLARVEQRLFRPSSDQVQFVNIVKRNEYRYAGFFAPDAGKLQSGARLDFLQATVRFDRGIPESILDWPSFFADAGDDLNIVQANTKIGNNRPSASNLNSDYIESVAVYNPVKDELGGVACGAGVEPSAANGCFQKLVIGFNDGTNHVEYRVADCGGAGSGKQCTTTGGVTYTGSGVAGTPFIGQETDGAGSGDLFATAKQPVYILGTEVKSGINPVNSADNALWILSETYAIDNGGNLLNINSILGSKITDPFAYLRTVAGHSVVTVRHGNYDKIANSGGSTLFSRGNIDLIMIPDLAVDLVQKLASQLE